MEIERRVRQEQSGGRRATDLSAEQQLAIAHAIVTFSELARDESVMASRLLLLIDTCRALMDRCDFTVTLRDDVGSLHLVGSTSDLASRVELGLRDHDDRPIHEAMQLGNGMLKLTSSDTPTRWPTVFGDAEGGSYESIYVVPLRTGSTSVGVLTVYDHDGDDRSNARMEWICTLSSSAALSLRGGRSSAQLDVLQSQLQPALSDRVVLDRATEIVAIDQALDASDALETLRQYALKHSSSIVQVAEDVVANRVSPHDLAHDSPSRASEA